jgi:uncharacterized protein
VIGKAQAAKQPSIDELLASIRQAIHERVAPPAQARSPSIVPSKPPLPESETLNPAADVVPARRAAAGGSGAAGTPMKRTIVTTGPQGFAGLLGGDVRLEEALARLNQAGWRRGAEALPTGETAKTDGSAAEMPTASPRLRPTIEDWIGGVTSVQPAVPERPTVAGLATAVAGRRRDEDPTPPTPRPLSGSHQTQAARFREGELWEHEPMYEEHSAPTSLAAEPPAHIAASQKSTELLSSEAARATSSAFNKLADAIVCRPSGDERTLDEFTRDMLRPLLKTWLDQNLPGIVERLVREEIERVARPGR